MMVSIIFCMAQIVQRVDALFDSNGCVLTANFYFLLEGNDYDEVDAQMQMADSDPAHFDVEGHLHRGESAPVAHDSGSVPPGLNGHHDSSSELQHGSPIGGQEGGAGTSDPSALPEDKDNVPMAPPDSEGDSSLPSADSTVAEPAIHAEIGRAHV